MTEDEITSFLAEEINGGCIAPSPISYGKCRAIAKRLQYQLQNTSSNNKYTAPQATPKSCPSCGQGSAIYIDSCGHCGYSWA